MKRVGVWPVLGLFLGLVLISCGQVSLLDLLDSEAPGSFAVQPAEATLVEGATVDILPQGGFRPYSLELFGEGELVGSVYRAPPPPDIPAAGLVVEIEATDGFGSTATSTLMIFARLTLSPSSAAVLDTETVEFGAGGGQAPYDFYLDDVLVAGNSVGSWTFPASSPGTYRVEVEDSREMRAAATVTVVASDPTVLAISPTEATTTAGGATVDFAVSVPAGHGHTLAATEGSVAPVNAITWRYTPPDQAATDTLTLTDTTTLETATATVTVLELPSTGEPLAISPASVRGVVLSWGAQMIFTASGGVPGVPPLPLYTFRLEGDDVLGTLELVAPNKVRYTAPLANAVNRVYLTDAVGDSVSVKVRSAK